MACNQPIQAPLIYQSIERTVWLRIAGNWLHGGYTEARKQKAHSEEWAKCLIIWWPIAESNHGHADFQDKSLVQLGSGYLEET